MNPGKLAGGLGSGLLAGCAGTLAITASQKLEMAFTGREPSKTPAKVAEKILDIQPKDEAAESRLVQLVHFGYGTVWGLARPIFEAAGIRGHLATIFHWGAVQQGAMVLLPALKVAPPPIKWGRKTVVMEMVHHMVYAAAAGWVHSRAKAPSSTRFCLRPAGSGGMAWALLFGILMAAGFLLQAGPLPERTGRESDG